MPGRAQLEERSQPSRKSFGAPMSEAPGQTTRQRPKAGPADPETRRKALKTAMDSSPTTASPKPSAPYSSIDRQNPTKDITVGTAARRLRERRLTLSDAEDAALK